MNLDKIKIFELAELLDFATLNRQEVKRLTLTQPQLTLREAYLIQDEGISLRVARGEKTLGFKLGLTSEAKRQQMNLNSPIYGILTDRMSLENRKLISLRESIHPKIEPEIAFFIGREIKAPISLEEALDACTGVCAAMEILDSRFVDFKYFSLPDVIADNCSSAFFVLSNTIKKPSEIDVSNLEMTMCINNRPVQKAYSGAISSHPGKSIVQLCDLLGTRGLSVPAGSLVLAGAATQAEPLEPGMEVRLTVEHLGEVSLSVVQE